MQSIFILCLLCACFAGFPKAYAGTCPTKFNPKSFQTGDFFSNFDNKCYWNEMSQGNGANGTQGDLDSVYNRIYFKIDTSIAPYQLMIVDDFPNARYMSIVIYDDHSAVS